MRTELPDGSRNARARGPPGLVDGLVQELIGGEVGLRQGNDNMPPADRAWWDDDRERVEAAAQATDGR